MRPRPGRASAGRRCATAALARELGEELGIVPGPLTHFSTLEHDYPDLRVRIDFYRVTAFDGTPRGREGQALQWVLPADLEPDLLLPADRPVLKLLK